MLRFFASGLWWLRLRSVEAARENDVLLQAQADGEKGNYSAATALAATLPAGSRAKLIIDKTITHDRFRDKVAWDAYARAASQYVRAAENIYNDGDGPPTALFNQLVLAAHNLVERPHEWFLSESEIAKNLKRTSAKTYCIDYLSPSHASNIAYNIRVLRVSSWSQLFDSSSGTSFPKSTTNCLGSSLLHAALFIDYKPKSTAFPARTISKMPANFINDAAAADGFVSLPMPHGFAVAFDGLTTLLWGGSADYYVLHVVRAVEGKNPSFDGTAIPSDVFVTHLHGLIGTGYTVPSGGHQESPFFQCLACPNIETEATVKWNGSRYLLASTAIKYTAFAALVRYVETGSDAFVTTDANFSSLSHLRTLINYDEDHQNRCSMSSDTSASTPLHAIATVKIICPTPYGYLNISVKALRTSKVFKLQDAFVTPS